MTLASLGWTGPFAAALPPGLTPGRIFAEHRGAYWVYTESGELTAELSGHLRHRAAGRGELPATGDWVALRESLIQTVLARQTRFSRKAAGDRTEEQIVAANIDVVFLVSALDRDFNPRRIERYLTLAWESGARPVVVLNKADLCGDLPAKVRESGSVAPGVDILVTSFDTPLDELAAHIGDGRTAAFLGSSGVGKSTLINRLLGDN